jgi:hypothetical protein
MFENHLTTMPPKWLDFILCSYFIIWVIVSFRKLGQLQSGKSDKDKIDDKKKAVSDVIGKGDEASVIADEKRIKDLMKGMSISEEVSFYLHVIVCPPPIHVLK